VPPAAPHGGAPSFGRGAGRQGQDNPEDSACDPSRRGFAPGPRSARPAAAVLAAHRPGSRRGQRGRGLLLSRASVTDGRRLRGQHRARGVALCRGPRRWTRAPAGPAERVGHGGAGCTSASDGPPGVHGPQSCGRHPVDRQHVLLVCLSVCTCASVRTGLSPSPCPQVRVACVRACFAPRARVGAACSGPARW